MASSNTNTPSTTKFPRRLGLNSGYIEDLSTGFERAVSILGVNAREVTLSPSIFEGKQQMKFLAVKVLADTEDKWRNFASHIKAAFNQVTEVTIRYSGT